MQISVTFRGMDPSDDLRDYVERKFSRFKRFLQEPIDVKVVLGQEKFRYEAEVVLNAEGFSFVAKHKGEDAREVVDLVLDKVERQVRDRKGKVRERPLRVKERVVVERPEGLEVIEGEGYPLKPMSLEEALREVEGSETGFVVFIEESTDRINLLYRKKSGGYGLLVLEA